MSGELEPHAVQGGKHWHTPNKVYTADKDRIKPTSSPFMQTAYELTPTSLSLADKHPNVLKRGGKLGREAEYSYPVGTSSCHALFLDLFLDFDGRSYDIHLRYRACRPPPPRCSHGQSDYPQRFDLYRSDKQICSSDIPPGHPTCTPPKSPP